MTKEIPLTQKSLKKVAFPPLIIGILALLGVGGAAFGALTAIRGKQENIAEDARDLLGSINSLQGSYPQSSEITEELASNATELSQICDELLQATNQRSGNQAEASDFAAKMSKADMLVHVIQQHFDVLASREHLSIVTTQGISGHLSAVENGLASFTESLAQAGQAMSEHRQEQPSEQQDHPQSEAPPPPMSHPQLSAQDKQAVVNFLNQKYQPGGISLDNLEDKLYEVAEDMTRYLGVSNLTGNRLQSANVGQLRRLFEVWANPGAAIGYFGK